MTDIKTNKISKVQWFLSKLNPNFKGKEPKSDVNCPSKTMYIKV